MGIKVICADSPHFTYCTDSLKIIALAFCARTSEHEQLPHQQSAKDFALILIVFLKSHQQEK